MRKAPESASSRWFRRACLAGLLAVAGCAVGPNFQKPQVSMPAGWVGAIAQTAGQAATPGEVDLANWWTVFNDPVLTSLVDRAVQSNLDLKQAEARVRQARAQRGIAVSGIGPALDATGAFHRGQSSGTGPTTNLYDAGFDAGWEIDVFGGVRRNIESADASLQAAIELRRDVLVTLVAEVAVNYVDLRSFQTRIEIARRNLKAQQHSADLTRQRFEGGLVSGLDVANADAQVASTAAVIPLLETAARQDIYSLSVLLGQNPAALLEELSPTGAIPGAAPVVPLSVPSELLRRRPDIRAAEAEIHAATAQIGVATADLFPKFNLTGSLGFQAANSGDLFTKTSRFWGFGPSASWQLFQSGGILSNIDVQKALQDQSVITYQQTVLTALQEVENTLYASTKEREHRQSLVQAVDASRKAVDLSTQLYVEGQTDFLNVLAAQRSLFGSEDALAQSDQTLSTDLIALFKALGGGWSEQATQTAKAAGEGQPTGAGSASPSTDAGSASVSAASVSKN